jgi:hypothetical protein
VLASEQNFPAALAVDATSVYWVNSGYDQQNPPQTLQNNGSVMKVPLNGSSPPIQLVASQIVPAAIAVDATSVYWTVLSDLQGSAKSGEIRKIPIGGGAIVPLATGENYPGTLALDATNLYWASIDTLSDGYINKVPRTGGSAAPVISPSPMYSAMALSVDTNNVYFAEPTKDLVGRVAVGGGTPTIIASGQSRPGRMAIDATYVYWVANGDSAVRKAPLGSMSATPTDVATGQSSPSAVAADSTGVYWTNSGDGTIMRAPLGGGTPVPLAQGQVRAGAIALDAATVYWIMSGPSGAVMKLAK